MGGGSSAPEAPDYAAANREGVYADIQTLPDRLAIERAAQTGGQYTYDTGQTEPVYEYKQVITGYKTDYLGNRTPQYTTQQVQVGTRPVTKTADFTGLGDSALLAQQLKDIQQSAPGIAQAQLDLQNQFGNQFIDQARQQLQRSDPNAFALNEQFNQGALDDLKLGDQLSSSQQRTVEQNTRGAQASRGNLLGPGASAQEIIDLFGAGESLKAQRQNVAANALGRGGISNQFGQVAGAQAGAAPFSPQQPNTNYQYLNPNAGNMGAQFALGNYQNQYNSWQGTQQAGNSWMPLAGAGIGIAATAAIAL
jgi:hypothetical protein